MADSLSSTTVSVVAELQVPMATVQLAWFNLNHAVKTHFDAHHDQMDLCLTPRPTNLSARFKSRWSTNRFEKLGQVCYLPQNEAVQIKTEGGRQLSVICKLNSMEVRSWLGRKIEWKDGYIDSALDLSSVAIITLMRRLADELRSPSLYARNMVELIVGEIAIEVSRYVEKVDRAPLRGGLAAWRLRRIDNRVAELREAPTLEELARICNLSTRQMTRAFRAEYGCSVGAYVRRARIELIKRLLIQGHSVKGAARAMNFSSDSHLVRMFRREVGLTPSEFKTRCIKMIQ